jgi:hypothetical protein
MNKRGMNKIRVYKLGKHGWMCDVQFGSTTYMHSVEDWHDLAQRIVNETAPYLNKTEWPPEVGE